MLFWFAWVFVVLPILFEEISISRLKKYRFVLFSIFSRFFGCITNFLTKYRLVYLCYRFLDSIKFLTFVFLLQVPNLDTLKLSRPDPEVDMWQPPYVFEWVPVSWNSQGIYDIITHLKNENPIPTYITWFLKISNSKKSIENSIEFHL